jgi:hypothetical protein
MTKTKKQFNIDDYLGLTQSEAEKLIKKAGHPVKVIMLERKYYPGELNLTEKTVHLHIEDGKVIYAYWDE